jgi:16S rRNA (cytosine1402-N4)-methyltransferase
MEHIPVMCEAAVRELAIKPSGVYLDCTFGRGGHSQEILKCMGPVGKLLAFDRDSDAVNSEMAILLRRDERFELQQKCFSALLQSVIEKNWVGEIDGVLIDVGVSSPQLDNAGRGFSFLQDGPLDMRMDTRSGQSAEQWLEKVAEQDLIKVLFEFGEERFARRIARAIVEQRQISAISTTRQLAELIAKAVPSREKHKHPATRSFQAIRIKINRELEEIDSVLGQAVSVLKPGGRLVVIAFHSLEDRIVKRFIRDEARGKYRADKLPIQQTVAELGRLRKRGKAMRASAAEISRNPRSRSAVMRVAERI